VKKGNDPTHWKLKNRHECDREHDGKDLISNVMLTDDASAHTLIIILNWFFLTKGDSY